MKMMRKWQRLTLVAIAMLMLVTASTPWHAHAAVPKLDHIRVGLFMSLPGKYTSTTAAATFSSEGGLTVGLREPDSVQAWFSLGNGQRVRIAPDDYKVMLFQSASFAEALAVYQHVDGAKGAPYLTALPGQSGTVYRVTEGAYAASAEATSALARWNSDAKLAGLTKGFKAAVAGPLRVETTPFKSKQEAAAAAATFGEAGIDAYVAVRANAGGGVSYSVMAGSAASAEELKRVQEAAAKTPHGKSLKAVPAGSRYLLLQQDHSLTGKADSFDELYQFPAGDMKLWLTPKGGKPIQLAERSGRSYRGQFEISVLNGKMAVVNELPFEQYLYSVVGAEVYSSWPQEALKAQAVAARSYALNKGFGFQIAHVVDTTLSQAYFGVSTESPSVIQAVDSTKGEVALYNGKVIEALFSSSGGGMTADATEVWGNEVPYLKPVSSPDQTSEAGLMNWHRVVLSSGKVGYIREDLLKDTGSKTAAGSRILELTTDGTRVRKHPVIQDAIPLVAELNKGVRVVEIGKVKESNAMNWIRGPYSSDELIASINARIEPKLTGPIASLAVTKRGPSGRAVEIAANGSKLPIRSPDSIRSVLGSGGSLPSTLFQIEESGKVVMQGAGSAQRTKTAGNQTIYIAGADGKATAASGEHLFIMNGDGEIRPATKEASFQFNGKGNGHGVGLSQYGTLGLAQQGYDYQYILKYYYKGITIAKE